MLPGRSAPDFHIFHGISRLGLQAYSLGIAYELVPCSGLSISRADPLPHRIQVPVATETDDEGINLQCRHILFNYDIPWNPTAKKL